MSSMLERICLLLKLINLWSNKLQEKKCYVCGKSPLSKNEIGLAKKLINKNTDKFYCIDCLANYLEVTTDELEAKIEEFKDEGCKLFS